MTRKPSVQLYYRPRPPGRLTQREGTLKRLADIGFTAVEPYDPTTDPTGFRELADDLGLTVSSTHAMAMLREPDPAPVFEAVAPLGTDLAILPAGIPEEDFNSHDGLEHAADLLNALAAQGRRGTVCASATTTTGGSSSPCSTAGTPWRSSSTWSTRGPLRGRHLLGHRRRRRHPGGPAAPGRPGGGAARQGRPGRQGRAERRRRQRRDAGAGRPGRAPKDAWRVIEFDECATDVFEALAASLAYVNDLEEAVSDIGGGGAGRSGPVGVAVIGAGQHQLAVSEQPDTLPGPVRSLAIADLDVDAGRGGGRRVRRPGLRLGRRRCWRCPRSSWS